jgi:HK97 family phage prohead protease
MLRYRNYEVAAFPFSQLEYGGGGYIGGVDGKSVPLPDATLYDDDHKRFIAQGYAVRWKTPIRQGNKLFYFRPGAILTPIANEVRFEFGHNDSDIIGSTADGRLSLHADEYGLAMRFAFGDHPNHQRAFTSIKNGECRALSIGCNMYGSKETDEDGIKVRVVWAARLSEISLCPSGACEPAFIELIEAEDAQTLEQDCKSLRVLSNGAAYAVSKALGKLKTQLALAQ